VERGLVRQAGHEEAGPQPVEHRVGGLVRDHVVREACVGGVRIQPSRSGNAKARPVPLGPPHPGRHVTEQHGAHVVGVVRVGLGHGVRHQVQLVTGEPPVQAAADGRLEHREGAGGDRVRILRVERGIAEQRGVGTVPERVVLRTPAAWRLPGARRQGRGREQHPGRRVVVDDLEP
jgi:hypothetical protein